jgi:hypothetical protein
LFLRYYFQDPSLENAINGGAKLNPVKTEEKNTLPSQADIDAEKAAADGV